MRHIDNIILYSLHYITHQEHMFRTQCTKKKHIMVQIELFYTSQCMI